MSEEELIQRVIERDPQACRLLVKRYENLVLHIIFKIINNKTEREDLAQEVFLKVFSKIDSFKMESKLSTWIGNIAFNTSIKSMRKKKPLLYQDSFQNELDDMPVFRHIDYFTSEHRLIEKETHLEISKAISRLSKIQQILVVLYHQEEQTYDEIAKITDLPIGTVKNYLFRARSALRKMLSNKNNFV